MSDAHVSTSGAAARRWAGALGGDLSQRHGAAGRGTPPAARAEIKEVLGRRVIAYHPAFAAVAGSVTAGVFLAQLFYWHDRGRDPDGWIYKTQAAWEEETGLTRWQQETARRKLRECGLLEERLAGLPARVHYRLDVERLIELLSARVRPLAHRRSSASPRLADSSPASSWERHNQDCGIPTNKSVGTPQTSSRGSRIHAETTREHSRKQRAERLAAGFQEPSSRQLPSDRLMPSAASSSGLSSTASGGPAEDRLDGTSDIPSEVVCSLHGVSMRLREKDGDRWYSHRLDDGAWCKGARGDCARSDYALGDRARDQGRGWDDPESIESRREYLAWADPQAHRALERTPEAVARRASYSAQWEAVRGGRDRARGGAGRRRSPARAGGVRCQAPERRLRQVPGTVDSAGARKARRAAREEHGSQESIGSHAALGVVRGVRGAARSGEGESVAGVSGPSWLPGVGSLEAAMAHGVVGHAPPVGGRGCGGSGRGPPMG